MVVATSRNGLFCHTGGSRMRFRTALQEVAMLTSDHRIFRSFAAFMMGGAVLLGGVGCADNMNHTLSTKAKGMESYERGDYVDAASAFQNVIREEPRDYKARYYLGNSYAQSGQFQRAIQAYRT